MNKIEIYSTPQCPWCSSTKALLRREGLDFMEIDISSDESLANEMISRSGRRSVPQIFINDEHIGGFDELTKLDLAKKLNKSIYTDGEKY